MFLHWLLSGISLLELCGFSLAWLLIAPPLITTIGAPSLELFGALLIERGFAYVVFNLGKLALFAAVIAFVFARGLWRRCRGLPAEEQSPDDPAPEGEG